MRYKLGSMMLENSLAHNVSDDELFLADGFILCEKCGFEKELYLKDRDICKECYIDEQDYLASIMEDR